MGIIEIVRTGLMYIAVHGMREYFCINYIDTEYVPI